VSLSNATTTAAIENSTQSTLRFRQVRTLLQADDGLDDALPNDDVPLDIESTGLQQAEGLPAPSAERPAPTTSATTAAPIAAVKAGQVAIPPDQGNLVAVPVQPTPQGTVTSTFTTIFLSNGATG
jgi:hypothetical protein